MESQVDISVFDRLLDHMVEQENRSNGNCSFIICGDMNARTKNLSDMIESDDSRYVPLPDDYLYDNNIARYSQDKVINAHGHLLLDFCRSTSLIMLNRRSGSDKDIGNFTCHTHRGNSLIDYVLVSKDLFTKVNTFDVEGPNILSDHSVI